MSNVLERYRDISKMEYYKRAQLLKNDMLSFLLREKNLPKKYRGTVYYPMRDHFDELLSYLRSANKVFINGSLENKQERMGLQNKALAKIEDIYCLLQECADMIWYNKLHSSHPSADSIRLKNALNGFAYALRDEEDIITNWKNSNAKTATKKMKEAEEKSKAKT